MISFRKTPRNISVRVPGCDIAYLRYYYVINARQIYDRLLSSAVYTTVNRVKYPLAWPLCNTNCIRRETKETSTEVTRRGNYRSIVTKYLGKFWGKRARILPRREINYALPLVQARRTWTTASIRRSRTERASVERERERRPGAHSRRQSHFSSSTCQQFVTGKCARQVCRQHGSVSAPSLALIYVFVSHSERGCSLTTRAVTLVRSNLPRTRGVFYRARATYNTVKATSAIETAAVACLQGDDQGCESWIWLKLQEVLLYDK